MTALNRHIIQRQTVWLDTPGLEPPFALQERVSAYCRHQLPAVLETLFDQLADADTTIRLDQLIIDAGRLSAQNLEEELTQQVIRQIETAFGQNSDSMNGSAAGFYRLNRNEQMAQQLRYFLQKGLLSAWMDTRDFAQVDAWLRTPAAVPFRSELRSMLSTNPDQLRRFMGHSSNETLVMLAFSEEENVSDETIRQLLTSTHSLTQQPVTVLHERYWGAVLTVAVRKGTMTFADSLRTLQQIAAPAESARAFFGQMLSLLPQQHISPGSTVKNQLVQTLTQLLAGTPSAGRSSIDQQGPIDIPSPVAPSDGEDQTQTYPYSEEAEDRLETRPAQPDREPTTFLTDEYDTEQDVLLSQPAYPSPEQPRPVKKASREVDAEEGLFVPMAGVVLLHPFLVTLFSEMSLLTTNRQWADEAAAARAVQRLAFLATGQEYCPEYEMPLLKFLCGIPVETVVSPQLSLTDTDRQLTTELLEAVIKHWNALGNVSPDGLREAFLQREGKLVQTETGWRLTVERKTLDILLGRLPWGFSMIKLPYMPDLLVVDWN
ncbi:hypothetical protein HNV11_06915 [Spirosoma taeanense]|uniref:Uncharacterized protein n=1 Tax=Spirosoma taeanense TaxID=2735870 RepID=A0A6M5Y7D1_9BACT|nr:contractile injection system tape measure protein [Spirosoma taeanense]QJW89141.1 hypothetical protein HNV11_06915 [Spirosoma taeanense]